MQVLHITKTIFKTLILTCTIVVLAATPSFAQDDWEEAGENDLPLDGGLSILLAAGAGYGAYKRKQVQKQVK
jgi:hypothetical protein